MMTGMPLAEIRELREERLLAALGAGIPPARHTCALLAYSVVQEGIESS
jgi:NifU-like protein involved in Fe-S cluster formation